MVAYGNTSLAVAIKKNHQISLGTRNSLEMKTSPMIAGVCLLVFTVTIAECGHVISKKQTTDSPTDNSCIIPSPDLQQCFSRASVDATAICVSHCRSEIMAYYMRCFDGAALDSIIEALNILCDNNPDMIPDPCQPSNLDTHLRDCIDSFEYITPTNTSGDSSGGHGSGHGSGDSLACSSECRSQLEDYYEMCTADTTLQAFRETYNSLCDTPDMPGIDDSCINVPPNIQDSVDSFDDNDLTTGCTSMCRFELEAHFERCSPADIEAFREAYNFVCGSRDMSGIDDSCQLSNLNTNLRDCISSFEDITSASSGGDNSGYGSGGSSSGNSLACSSECRYELDDYYVRCTDNTDFQAFSEAYNSVCGSPDTSGIDDSCQLSNLDTHLRDCISSFEDITSATSGGDKSGYGSGGSSSGNSLACSSECKYELDDYYVRCTDNTDFQAFSEAYNSACGSPDMSGIDDSCQLSSLDTNLRDCISSFEDITSATSGGDNSGYGSGGSSSGNSLACSSECRYELDDYYMRCTDNTDFQAFIEAYNSVCGSPGIDDSCQLSNLHTNLRDCISSFEDITSATSGGDKSGYGSGGSSSGNSLACSSECRYELDDYYVRCTDNTDFQAFSEAYNSVCGSPGMSGIDDSCQLSNLDTHLRDCISSFEDITSATSGGDNGGYGSGDSSSGNSLACSSECRYELDDYYVRCTDNTDFQAFSEAYNSVCGSPGMSGIDDSCQLSNLDTHLRDCISSFEDITSATSGGDNGGYGSGDSSSGNSLACSSECRYELDDYYVRCTDNTDFQAFREAYNSVCGSPDTSGIDDSCQLSNLDTNLKDCISSFEDITSASSGGDKSGYGSGGSSSGNSLACSTECRYELDDYYVRCTDNTDFQAFSEAYNSVCGSPGMSGIDDSCQLNNVDTNLRDCISSFEDITSATSGGDKSGYGSGGSSSGISLACSSECRYELDDYYVRCTDNTNFQAFSEAYNFVCGSRDMSGIDDSCQLSNLHTNLRDCISSFEDITSATSGGDNSGYGSGGSSSGNSLACSTECRYELDDYYVRCTDNTDFQAFSEAYNSVCGSPGMSGIDDSCQLNNVDTNLRDCISSFEDITSATSGGDKSGYGSGGSSSGNSLACSSECRYELDDYYVRCTDNTDFQAFSEAYNSVCGSPGMSGIDDSCQLSNLDTHLRDCISSFEDITSATSGGDKSGYGSGGSSSGNSLACGSECRYELDDYYVRCTDNTDFQAFSEAYNSVCGSPDTSGIDDSCQLSNLDTNLRDCISSFEDITSASSGGDKSGYGSGGSSSGNSLACSSECRYELDDYYVRCTDNTDFQAFSEAYNSACGSPNMSGIDDSCHLDAHLRDCISSFEGITSATSGGDKSGYGSGGSSSGNSLACSSECRYELDDYYVRCTDNTDFQAFSEAYNSVCGSPGMSGIDDSCQLSNLDTHLRDCISSFEDITSATSGGDKSGYGSGGSSSGNSLACSSECRYELDDYYVRCTDNTDFQAFREAYNSVCGSPDTSGIDDSCQLSNLDTNLKDCINSFEDITSATSGGDKSGYGSGGSSSGNSLACSSECRYELDDYYVRCTDNTDFQAFREAYNSVCGSPDTSGIDDSCQLSNLDTHLRDCISSFEDITSATSGGDKSGYGSGGSSSGNSLACSSECRYELDDYYVRCTDNTDFQAFSEAYNSACGSPNMSGIDDSCHLDAHLRDCISSFEGITSATSGGDKSGYGSGGSSSGNSLACSSECRYELDDYYVRCTDNTDFQAFSEAYNSVCGSPGMSGIDDSCQLSNLDTHLRDCISSFEDITSATSGGDKSGCGSGGSSSGNSLACSSECRYELDDYYVRCTDNTDFQAFSEAYNSVCGSPDTSGIDDSCQLSNLDTNLRDCISSFEDITSATSGGDKSGYGSGGSSSGNSLACSSECRYELDDYYVRCTDNTDFQAFSEAYNSACGSPNMSGIDDSCHLDAHLRDCISSFEGITSATSGGDKSGYGSGGSSSGNSLACSSECRYELDDYYVRCTDNTDFQAFSEAYNSVCGSPGMSGIDDSCQLSNLDTHLRDCISSFEDITSATSGGDKSGYGSGGSSSGNSLACSSECRYELDDYYVRCTDNTDFQAFREAYNSVCGSPDTSGIDDSCQLSNLDTNLKDCISSFEDITSASSGGDKSGYGSGGSSSGNSLACSSECRYELDDYYVRCTDNTDFQAFREAYNSVCGSPDTSGIDDSCQLSNLDTNLRDCISSFEDITSASSGGDNSGYGSGGSSRGISLACSSECRYELDDYYVRCIDNTDFQAFREAYNSVCGSPDTSGIDDSCQLSNLDTNLRDCISSFEDITSATSGGDKSGYGSGGSSSGNSLACSTECRYELDDYYVRCTDNTDFQAFREAYNSACGSPGMSGIDDSCQLSNLHTNLRDCISSFEDITSATSGGDKSGYGSGGSSSGNSLACGSECRYELDDYYVRCTDNTDFQAFSEAYNSVCGSPNMSGIDDSCQLSNLDAHLRDCISSFEDITSATSGGDKSGYGSGGSSNGNSLACGSECRYELDDYYVRCTDNTDFQAFSEAYNSVCGSPNMSGIDDSCQLSNLDAHLRDCISSFEDITSATSGGDKSGYGSGGSSSGNSLACSSECRYELDDYYVRCTDNTDFQAFSEAYNSVCGSPDTSGIDDSCQLSNLDTNLRDCISSFEDITSASSGGDKSGYGSGGSSSGNSLACSSECRYELDDYYVRCTDNTDFQAFSEAYNSVCGSPNMSGIDDSCQLSNLDAHLRDCISSFEDITSATSGGDKSGYGSGGSSSGNSLACSSECRYELDDYYVRCTDNTDFQAFSEAYNSVCGSPDTSGIDDSCQLSNLDTNLRDCISSFEDITSASSGGDKSGYGSGGSSSGNSLACSSECRYELDDYYVRCTDNTDFQAFSEAYNSICDTTDMPGIDDFCLNVIPSLQRCITASDDTAVICNSECRSELTDYYRKCTDNAVYQVFIVSYNLLCADVSGMYNNVHVHIMIIL